MTQYECLLGFRGKIRLAATVGGIAFCLLTTGEATVQPEVSTDAATAVGTTGMTLNGKIHPHGLYTRYFFEYGTSDKYGQQTPLTELPPRLSAYISESWDDNAGGWYDRKGPVEHHARGGATGGFVRYTSPTTDDYNHDDGIGTLHLAPYMYTGSLRTRGSKDLSWFLSAGRPDLRGAKISLGVRGRDWIANGSELLWWTQSQSNIEVATNPGWRRANWAYTGFLLTDYLQSGGWERVDYQLEHDSEKWTFGGFNTQQENWQRYSYWPIDQAQADVNYDFIYVLAFVDPENPPEGAIDFDDFQLIYRNKSLVFPGNGGKLIASPASDANPATLTDGWRNGPDRMWRSALNPQAPLEFIYAFEAPVTIRAVQLHQNPDWPAREVECLISRDGQSFESLCQESLPEKGVPNDNFAFALVTGLSVEADFLKVRILSGYGVDRWGLGEIEVFGDGARMLPDDDWYQINLDVGDLKPGVTYHYRIVAVSDHGSSHGMDRSFAIPLDPTPRVRTGRASRISATTAKVEGRVNPLGLRTKFYFEYGTDTRYGAVSELTYAGLQLVPRTVSANLTSLQAETIYHYRVVAENENGRSFGSDATFQTRSD